MLLNGRVVFLPAGGAFQFQNIRGLGHHREILAQAFLAILGHPGRPASRKRIPFHGTLEGMTVRLIALDIDGTLLDSRWQLPEANRAAIAEAARRGIEVALVTGRRYDFAMPVARKLDSPLTMIVNNGALIRSKEGQTHLRHLLPRQCFGARPATHEALAGWRSGGFRSSARKPGDAGTARPGRFAALRLLRAKQGIHRAGETAGNLPDGGSDSGDAFRQRRAHARGGSARYAALRSRESSRWQLRPTPSKTLR